MLRGAIGVFVLMAAVGGAIWHFCGPGAYNPTETGRKAKDAISEGMSWRDVCDVTDGGPTHYYALRTEMVKFAGEEIEQIVKGAELEFDYDLFEQAFEGGRMPVGFIFPYFYSHQVAFEVSFDTDGKVSSIDDMRTAADLLDMRG